MYSHMMARSNDLDRSRKLSGALFAAPGGKACLLNSPGRLVYGMNDSVPPPIDGAATTLVNGMTVGFAKSGREQADAWHAADVVNGSTASEDDRAVRSGGGMKPYLGHLRDADGNRLCALHPRAA